jgi:hypothetical protein
MTVFTGLLKMWFNGTERVIAADAHEARDIVVSDLGCDPDEVEAFEEVTDLDKPLRIGDESDGFVSMTCREWIEKEGRGLLCSTEMP